MDSERLARTLNEVLSGRRPLEALAVELRGHPELAIFDNKFQYTGDTATLATLPRLADWMMDRARAVGVTRTVTDLNRYLTTDQIPFFEIMVLASIVVKETISLSNGIELIPFGDLPPSKWKECVVDYFGKSWANYRPSAAVRRHVSHPRKHFDKAIPQSSEPNEIFQALEDIRLCMTVIGPSAPLRLGSWIRAEDWVPNLTNWALLAEPLNVGGYAREAAENWEGLPSLHARWLELNEPEQDHLRVPLSRINSALRHPKLIDSAIDLGIAIDSLFLVTGFQLRLRAARYLRTAETDRREIAKVFSALWKLRNDAVHEGKVEGKSIETRKLLNLGYRLATEAISRMIREGMPDWDTVIFG